MKVAVTSTGKTLESPMDPRFGRAEFFLVADTETMAFEVRENRQNLDLPQGAGIQAGKTVADLGVEAVITGNLGPKAYNVLEAAGIRTITGVSGTVRQALERFKAGALVDAGGPNVEGHWV
jgi:predicted Fe-Mo cluster-binding NifX family protein